MLQHFSRIFAPRPDQLRITRVIGKGAYGEVHEGTLGTRPVAIKRLHQILIHCVQHDKIGLEMMLGDFRRECELLEKARSPHVVEFLGVFNEEDSVLLVMELMYQTLQKYLKTHKGSLPLEKQLDICYQVSCGLLFLHQHDPQILHRDVTTNNILLNEDGSMVKISDLGQAKYRPSDIQYLTTRAPGCVIYMPPECLCDNPCYSDKGDTFSFGVVMLEVSTQEPPSCGLMNIGAKPERERRARDLNKLPDDHPLKQLINCCLDDDRHKRPNMMEIQAKLRNSQQMDSFQAKFIKAAIKEGRSVEVEITKCVTLGPPGAGKTQLKMALFGDFEESTESTIASTGAEVVMNIFMDSEHKWEKFDHTRLQSVLYNTVRDGRYDLSGVPSEVQKSLPSPVYMTHESVNSKNLEKKPGTIAPDRNRADLQHTQPTAKIRGSHSLEDAFISLKERVISNYNSLTLGKKHLNKAKLIHMVDSGGQPAFFDIHPIIATSRAIYLLVYNSKEGLLAHPEITYRKPRQFPTRSIPNKKQTNLDMIGHSLSTLQHCKKKFLKMEKKLRDCLCQDDTTIGQNDVLPIIVIGSRKRAHSQDHTEASSLLKSHCCDIPTWGHTQRYVTLIESRDPSCSGVKRLRQTISDAECKFKMHFPLLWFQCQLIFWSAEDLTLSVMTYGDLSELCIRHHLVFSEQEFLAMLLTFHMLGIFSCPDISHTDVDPNNTENLCRFPVFTKPDVLFQQVTRILEIPFRDLDSPGHGLKFSQTETLEKLQKSGILAPDCLGILGIPDVLGSFPGFHSYLLKCLVKWGLAAELPEDPQKLFIPSVLTTCNNEMFMPNPNNIPQFALTIITEESTKYCIPQGLFPHLVVSLATRQRGCYTLQGIPRCRDVIAFIHDPKEGTKYPYNIYALDMMDHISIHFDPAQREGDSTNWSASDCHIIVNELKHCMTEVYSKLFGEQEDTSVCLCTPCGLPEHEKHLASLDSDRLVMCCLSPENTVKREMVCSDKMKSILKGGSCTGLPSAQEPQSRDFYSQSPSDIGLNKLLTLIPLWHSLAVNLGVPFDQVQAYDTKPLGGLLALRHWRDGRSGESFPSTWGFLLKEVKDTCGKNVAKILEEKASKEPTWSHK